MRKRIFSTILLAVGIMLNVAAQETITQDITQLPATARSFVEQYFAQQPVSHIKIDNEMFEQSKYEVVLQDRSEINFDKKGKWIQVDCKRQAVPDALVPDFVKTYLSRNWPSQIITQIERQSRGMIEVELANDISITFNKKGKMVKMDD